MNLLNMPDEILMIIIKQLDVTSLYNLYRACDRVRNIIIQYGVIKTCNLSLCTMANAKTLKFQFFKDISSNLKELNLSGVCDLYKSGLLPVIKRLKCLNTLDVTYTNINITDFIELYHVCPTITDISVNFSFDKLTHPLHEEILYPYQDVFKNLLRVHFVGKLSDMMYTQIPNVILTKAKLKKLRYTIVRNYRNVNYNLMFHKTGMLNVDSFTIYFTKLENLSVGSYFDQVTHNEGSHGCLLRKKPFDVLDIASYETIVIYVNSRSPNKPICYATPIFENFFSKYCNPDLHKVVEFHIGNPYEVNILCPNAIVMMWNKNVTKFDDQFFINLWYKLKPSFPSYFESSSNTPVAPDYDLYVTVPHEVEIKAETSHESLKKQRIGVPKCILNYDSAFREKTKLKLYLKFKANVKSAITLSESCDYLKKLTYLSLIGPVRYSLEFFNILFKCCNNLVTLKINTHAFSSCSAALARSLPLSKTVKNIHLIDRDIDFPTLFSSMSQCKNLENVHLLDTTNFVNYADASIIFDKCVNLYCFYLYVSTSNKGKKKFMQAFKKANQKQRINAKLFCNNYTMCDPYSDVFLLNSLFY